MLQFLLADVLRCTVQQPSIISSSFEVEWFQRFCGLVGSVVGAKIEEARTRASGREYTIRLENGEVVSVVQAFDPKIPIFAGDDVKLLSQKGSYRVTRLNTAGRR